MSFRKRCSCSKDTKRKISIALKDNKNAFGNKHTEESKKKMRESLNKTAFKRGMIPWNKGTKGICKPNSGSFNKGQHPSLETEFKRERMLLEKHPNWQGGKSFEPYDLAWTKQLKQSIRERDNNVCQLCNKHQSQLKRELDVHHIDYVKTNSFTFNLISLCINCHRLTNYNRTHWTQFFRNYMNEKYGYNYNLNQETLNKIKEICGDDVIIEGRRV